MRAVLSVMRAFVSAGFRPRGALARGLVAALAVKLCVVVIFRLFLFSEAERPRMDPSAMDAHLTAPAADKGY